MDKNHLTKSFLIKRLAKFDLSYRAASMYIKVIIEAITEAIAESKTVQLKGLGSFTVKQMKPRKAKLKYGNFSIPAHWRVSFKPSKKLREAIKNIKKDL